MAYLPSAPGTTWRTPRTSPDVLSALRFLASYKWTILGIAVLITTAVVLLTLRQPKIYQATTSIEYDPNPARPLGKDVEDVTEPASYFWSTQEFYETQNRIIGSRTVAERVVRELGLHHDPSFLGRVENGAGKATPSIEDVAQILQARISVEQIRDTRLVHISVEDRDPERATVLANAVADSYIDKTVEDRLSATTRALEWLRTQLDNLRGQLNESELRLHKFKEKNNVLSLSLEDRQNVIANEINRLSQAHTETKMERIEAASKLEQLRAANTEDPLSVHANVVSESPVIAKLREEYRTTVAERETLATRYGEAHPELQAHDARLAELRRQMRAAIDELIASAERELAEIRDIERGMQQALAEAHDKGLELNLREIEYERLNRQKSNNEEVYNLLLERTTETDLARALKVSHVRIVDRALKPEQPIKPRLSLNVAAGSLAGLLMGIVFAFLLSRADRSIRTSEDLEPLGLTVLGIVPQIADQRGRAMKKASRRRRTAGKSPANPDADLTVHTAPRSPVAECCRTIRTNLTFMTANRANRSVVVASASPREGKTTVAISLAISMAQSGKRVLLVDTDLRKPRLHRTFNLDLKHGLTSVLVGELPLKEAIQETEVPCLSILPCGPVPPNPSELLHADEFPKIVSKLTSDFDLVVFDSPPLTAVTDAAIIGPQVDGAILVIRAESTTRDAVQTARRHLADVGTKLLGVVVNDVDLSSRRYGYGYGAYYYYHRDGYYGDSPSENPVRETRASA